MTFDRTREHAKCPWPRGKMWRGAKTFTIAYGIDADQDLLLRIANRTNGRRFDGDPDTIEDVYVAISAEQ